MTGESMVFDECFRINVTKKEGTADLWLDVNARIAEICVSSDGGDVAGVVLRVGRLVVMDCRCVLGFSVVKRHDMLWTVAIIKALREGMSHNAQIQTS